MNYLLAILFIVSIVWFMSKRTIVSFYVNILLLSLVSFFMFFQKNIYFGVLLSLSCIYFCLIYKVKNGASDKNTYKEGIKYTPVAVVLGYCLVPYINIVVPQTETSQKAIVASVLISMISILICFATIRTIKNRTKGDREYD